MEGAANKQIQKNESKTIHSTVKLGKTNPFIIRDSIEGKLNSAIVVSIIPKGMINKTHSLDTSKFVFGSLLGLKLKFLGEAKKMKFEIDRTTMTYSPQFVPNLPGILILGIDVIEKNSELLLNCLKRLNVVAKRQPNNKNRLK